MLGVSAKALGSLCIPGLAELSGRPGDGADPHLLQIGFECPLLARRCPGEAKMGRRELYIEQAIDAHLQSTDLAEYPGRLIEEEPTPPSSARA